MVPIARSLPFGLLKRLTNSRSSSCLHRYFSDNKNKDDEPKTEETKLPVANKKDFLPPKRPWEGPRPESEILKIEEQKFVDIRILYPKITDEVPPRGEMHPHYSSFKYPQFMWPDPPQAKAMKTLKLDYDIVVKEKRIFRQEKEFLYHAYDIVIIGGGIMGTSIAYQLKQRAPDSYSVLVIEKDPTVSL